VLSGRGLYDGPITRTQESYRLFAMCVTETVYIYNVWVENKFE